MEVIYKDEPGIIANDLKYLIESIKERILAGKDIEKDEAFALISIPIEDRDHIDLLIEAANEITKKLASKTAGLCSLLNTKSGTCSEDCKFCSQSSHFNTDIETYPLVDEEIIVKRAKEVESIGSNRYCLVTSGRELSEEAFNKIVKAYERLKKTTRLNLDASIGLLTDERAKRLKESGVTMVNHNLEASERYFKKICTTHSYADRKKTINNIKRNGMMACSGGIIGMGEELEDRIDLAFSLKNLGVDVVPINILNPRSGTPFEKFEKIKPLEIIKTIAVFRFILPRAVVKVAAGREESLGSEWQPLALKAGANGMIIGGYLTTEGNKPENDINLLKEAGYEIPNS